ncbi:hypothetical protein EV1_008862 [Malus domestica]
MRQRERERDFSDLKIHPLHTSSANQSSFLFYLPFAYFSRQLSTPVLGQKLLRSCKILLKGWGSNYGVFAYKIGSPFLSSCFLMHTRQFHEVILSREYSRSACFRT